MQTLEREAAKRAAEDSKLTDTQKADRFAVGAMVTQYLLARP